LSGSNGNGKFAEIQEADLLEIDAGAPDSLAHMRPIRAIFKQSTVIGCLVVLSVHLFES
jgi:hypothetical protein